MIRVYLLAAAAVVAIGAFAIYSYNQREAGRQEERTATERRNLDARNKADDADSELLRCIRDQLVFDFHTGKCRRAPPRPGE
jgi:hypothetical protein